MLNLNKHISFFNPADVTRPVHIIGCGALGSHIAEILVRLGVDKLDLWDFDTVDSHNITNQLYLHKHLGLKKTEALKQMLTEINPSVIINVHDRYEKQPISGYIFMMVDSIELRKDFTTTWIKFPGVKAVFDGRMRLTDAQAYAADWDSIDQQQALINTMQFTKEEALSATPVSACGTELSVTPTVKVITSLIVSNFINFILHKEVKQIILVDAFSYNMNAF